ncbi:MAG TPA: ABC transporter permease [Alphaproteobacteria bacterium]|nr:ABC transporter permease [Alphaproteobacteria bacterium]
MASPPTTEWRETDTGIRLVLEGEWTTAALDRAGWPEAVPDGLAGQDVTVEFHELDGIDSNASLCLRKWFADIEQEAASLTLSNPPVHFEKVCRVLDQPMEEPEAPPRRPLTDWLARLGQATFKAGKIGLDMLTILGQLTVKIATVLIRPREIRITSVVHHMYAAGVAALPIVGLLSFLIGVVTAYQGADQLVRFGAEILTVNVVGIGVLREMGPLIAAIVVAGRSASAFAAQIGTMKINEEIDALRVIGLDPIIVLVVPRTLALVIVFPFLVVYADALAILGGAIMATTALDISFGQFSSQFQAEVPLQNFWVGLSKAPLFASAIAGIGCYQGLQAGQGAAAVGEKTTAAVVQAIFLVIVIDALMSIVFSVLGV